MASQNPNHDDEIWKELFGGNEKGSPKRGHSTLAPSKKSKSRPSKKRKIDHTTSSSSNNTSQKPGTRSSSTTNGHHPSRSPHSSTTTSSSTAYHQDGPTTVERLSQFLCTPKHRARLPPPPLKPKFLLYPHDKSRFVKYCGTNLELNYNWQLHHDSSFAVPLDLMDPDYYNPLKNPNEYDDEAPMNHKADERILELLDLREAKRNAKEDRSLPEQEAFLLQTQYLTGGQEYELTESQRKTYDQNNNGYGSNRNGRKGHHYKNNKKRRRDYDDEDDDLEGEYNHAYNKRNNPHSIDNVRQTFIDIQNITRHPRRNVEVDKIFDVFPHEGLLEIDYTHVQFDKNPSTQTKKCQFMPKYQEERMKLAAECTNYSLLQCVNQKGLQLERKRNSKEENDDDDDDEDTDLQLNKLKNNDPDWFTLYATDDKKKRVSEDEVTRKYEWCAEYKPVGMDRDKKMHFMVIPKDNNSGEHEEVFYANFDDRISLRHRITDMDATQSMITGTNRLSETDKRFFQLQPFHIKLSVPHSNDSEVQ